MAVVFSLRLLVFAFHRTRFFRCRSTHRDGHRNDLHCGYPLSLFLHPRYCSLLVVVCAFSAFTIEAAERQTHESKI